MEGEEQKNPDPNQNLASTQVNVSPKNRQKSMNLTTNLNTISISNQNETSQNSANSSLAQLNIAGHAPSKYQELCQACLGRPHSCQEFQTIFQAIYLVFTDICQMQLPFAEMYNFAGIFIFRNHAFINPELFAQAVNSVPEVIIEHCNKELEEDNEERPKFISLMKSIVGDGINSWRLYKIKEKPENQWSHELLAVLDRFKAVSVDEYDNKIELNINLTSHSEEIADIEPDETLLENGMNPGLFYVSIVDEALKSTKEKCWILK